MGLRAASTSTASSSASNSIYYPIQKSVDVKKIFSNHLNNYSENKRNIELKDSKVFSNASVQSNMAPALTEPMSSANKLSSSTTSISPRPTSNSRYLSTNVNVNSTNLIDIETELLSPEISTINRGNNIVSAITESKTKGIVNNYPNDSVKSRLAFQEAFEQVILRQAAAETLSSSNRTGKKNCSKNSSKAKKSLELSKNSKISSSGSVSPQMGPMCDTNNLTKSHSFDNSSYIEYQILDNNSECDNIIDEFEETIIEEAVESESENKIQYMDLCDYGENEDSQQENTQVEINSSSSTVTAENTDVEDNTAFQDDNVDEVYETITINNEEMHKPETDFAEEVFDSLNRDSSDIASASVGITSQFEEQNSQNQNPTTQICSLTPKSIGSVGGSSTQKDFIKDAVEMDQVLGDMDLLQVLKGFDSAPGGENLCDLAGSLGLFNDVDVMNYEEMGITSKDIEMCEIQNEIARRQQQMQRKCDFLLRRLRKIQMKYMGRHISEEIAGLFEWTNRIVRRKNNENITREILYEEDKRLPVSTASMRSFLKRIDAVATSQHSKSNKTNKVTGEKQTLTSLKYNSNSTVKEENLSFIDVYDEKTVEDIERVSGMLLTQMKEVQSGFDSDVTASSSGGESADEMVTYNNPTQQPLSISQRAAWQWARDRAAIAARWTWLLIQISHLEFKISKHSDVYEEIKRRKKKVVLGNPSSSTSTLDEQQQLRSSVNGYRGTLPGSSKISENENNPPNGAYESNIQLGASRTRPFEKTSFCKRKLLQTAYLHTISKRAARPSTVKCGCRWPLQPCALCTGRSDPTAPRALPDTMTFPERVALLDPGFHSVLSFPEDVGSGIHVEAITRLPKWQNCVVRLPSKSLLKGSLFGKSHKAAEHSEDHSDKKLMGSRRKRNRKLTQDSGPANKIKKVKARRALHGNSDGHPHVKNNYKHRKLSSIGSMEHQDGMAGSMGSSIGNIDSLVDSNEGGGHNTLRSRNSSPTGNHSFTHRNENYSYSKKNKNSYDIDNIVIPYSVAATTRVEILPYKEIPTPKWRIVDDNEEEENESTIQNVEIDELEDISDFAIRIRHERALIEEKKKFQTYLKFPWSTRSRANRRIDSRAESSGANTPDPTSPASNTPNTAGDHESIPSPANPPTPQTPGELTEGSDYHTSLKDPIAALLSSTQRKGERRRTTSSKKDYNKEEQRSNSPDTRDIIPPFEPLEFPLSDEKYESMLKLMPNNHQLLQEDCSKINCDQTTIINKENNQDPVSGDIGKDGDHSNYSLTAMLNDKESDLMTTFNINENIIDCGSDTDSAESGMQEEDPNDPEWQEPVK